MTTLAKAKQAQQIANLTNVLECALKSQSGEIGEIVALAQQPEQTVRDNLLELERLNYITIDRGEHPQPWRITADDFTQLYHARSWEQLAVYYLPFP